ncbi:MAG: energy transducer TonB [Chitinophagaceae bacterium]|nr:energy transducer TonB [Chitinophagaceae bacterium]MCB9046097.1 energy transducer TonB [Chitinophagales bacterium]
MYKAVFIPALLMLNIITSSAQQNQDSITQKTRVVNGDTVIVETHPGGKKVITDPKTGQTQVFVYVEQMPEPGYDLYQFLTDNLVYPEDALKAKIEGRVNVKFIVTTTGDVTGAEVLKPVHPSLDKEALRVVSSMPKWKPGKQNGKTVNVYFTLPISFKL